MITRFLLVKYGCPVCAKLIPEVVRINMRLPIGSRIEIRDYWKYEYFGLKDDYLVEKFIKQGFNSYPFLYLQGIQVGIFPTPEQARVFLEEYFKEELLF